MNLIGVQERRRAAAAVRSGNAYSCGRPVRTTITQDVPHGPWSKPADLELPANGVGVNPKGQVIASDQLTVTAHGMYHTHIDALCHFMYDGVMYNGRPADNVRPDGAVTNDLSVLAGGITTRGVLLDIARLRGEYVKVDAPVLPEELDAAESAAALRVEPGDALVVRLGRSERWSAEGGALCERVDGQNYYQGMHPACLRWFRDRDISLLVSDFGHDAFPARFGMPYPVHIGALVFLGLPLVDNADLDDLATACAGQSQCDFLFTVAPPRIVGATSALVNPVAVL